MKPVAIANVNDLTHEQWLTLRKQGIGGSDIASVCGVSPYQSPLVTYMEKLSLYSRNFEDNESMKAGRKLEPVLAQWFTEESGLKTVKSNFMFRHPEHDWAFSNIDRFILPFHGSSRKGRGILEIKTTNEYSKGDWDNNEPPNHYLMQLQWYLFVHGLTWGAFAVLIGGNKFRFFFVDRDDDLIQYMFEIARRFWFDNVLAQVPPAIDGSDSTHEMYKIMNPFHNDERPVLELPFAALQWVEELQDAKAKMEEWKEYKQEKENLIKNAMGDHFQAFAGPHKITWKTDARGVRALKPKLNAREW